MRQVLLVSLAASCACSSTHTPHSPDTSQPQEERPASVAAPAASRNVTIDSLVTGKGQETIAQPRSAKTKSLRKAVKLPPETGNRIAAIAPHVWINPEPFTKDGQVALGNVRMGTSVKLRDPKPVQGSGCERGWYAIEPRGYVCLSQRTTLSLSDPYYLALRDVAPKKGELYPYTYAYSRGAPMYSRVPTPEEWKEAELGLGKPGTYAELGPWAEGHEELLEENKKIEATDEVPWYFAGGKRHVSGGHRSTATLVWKTIPNGSMLAYGRAFAMHGRVWLVTSDLTVVPADRVQPIKHHTFKGVQLNDEIRLPIAWNRWHDPRPIYVRGKDGDFVATDETLAGKSWVMITGDRKGDDKNGYYEIKGQPGRYLFAQDITISRKRKKPPPAIKPGEKWIDAHITPGTLTAYVGDEPVFATLFSPGKGGHPVPGNDHSRFATTQTGYFRYEWKEHVATMSNETGDPTVLWFSDVPHIQYIRAPLAMHVAYWHQDFANPKSAECVNVSAEDGRFLFGWTDPKLPEDWGAVRPGGGNGPSTPIMINGFWID